MRNEDANIKQKRSDVYLLFSFHFDVSSMINNPRKSKASFSLPSGGSNDARNPMLAGESFVYTDDKAAST